MSQAKVKYHYSDFAYAKYPTGYSKKIKPLLHLANIFVSFFFVECGLSPLTGAGIEMWTILNVVGRRSLINKQSSCTYNKLTKAQQT